MKKLAIDKGEKMKKLVMFFILMFVWFGMTACSDKFYEMKKSPCACLDGENTASYNQKSEFNS